MQVVNKGIPNTEMIGYEKVFSESDRKSLLDFILSEQKGVRDLLREEYKNEYFKGLELTSDLFKGTEASNAKSIPENTFWVENRFSGGIRFEGKFDAWQDADYTFEIRSPGRTLVFLNGELITKVGDDFPKEEQFKKALKLKKGSYDLEILHTSKRKHGHRIGGSYGVKSGERIVFHGRSLQGNTPKFVMAEAGKAKVVRKWIKGISPRSLLCFLPNNVIVAYDPSDGKVEKAWSGARVNQTPSLPDRSAAPSVIEGKEIKGAARPVISKGEIRFLGYQVDGDAVKIRSKVDGAERVITIKADGANAFSIQ